MREIGTCRKNRLTGTLIGAASILYRLCGLRFTWGFLCTTAIISTYEELVIVIKSEELSRDWLVKRLCRFFGCNQATKRNINRKKMLCLIGRAQGNQKL